MASQAFKTERTSRSDQLSLREVEQLQQELDEVRRAVLQEDIPQIARRQMGADNEAKQQLVTKLLRLRRQRSSVFDADLFGEPAWDMLLELYLADLRHVRHSVSGLCKLSGGPTTTAIRWLAKMEAAGLLKREGDAHDQRRLWVILTQDGYSRIDTLIDQFQQLL